MKVLIATGIYPPELGGPAEYAKQLKEELEKLGHQVVVSTHTIERRLPTGIRHLWYMCKTLPAFMGSDFVMALDTFSVGFPVAMLRKLFRRDTVIRTGGDFLWEAYVERTKEKILLSDFYANPRDFTFKERLIFGATKFALATIDHLVFSTEYQHRIWAEPYDIDPTKVSIIENRYEPAQSAPAAEGKTFVYAAARPLVWKNADVARQAFALAQQKVPDIRLEFLFDIPRDEALAKIQKAYAVVLTSLGDISPNYILRALSFGKPVILTSENGLAPRLGDSVMYVDPLDPSAIAAAIEGLTGPNMYTTYKQKVAALSFTHTYADIAREFLALHH